MPALSFTPLTELVAALVAGDVPASMDPAELNLPGAWVTFDNFTTHTHTSLRLQAVVFLIHSDIDYARAYERLAELFNTMTAAGVTPDGPVTPAGVVMPGDPTPLPALRVPVNLYT